MFIFAYMIIAFLVLLLLHTFLAAPWLVRKNKPWAYAAVTLVLLAVFVAYVLLTHGGPGRGMPPPEPPDVPEGYFLPPGGPPPPGEPRGRGPVRPEVLEILLGVLMLAANIGIIYRFRASHSAARIRELENELRQQRDEKTRLAVPVDETMSFRSEGKTFLVRTDQIRYIEGMSEYVKIWREDVLEPLVVLERLKNLQEKLPSDRFLRVHRSYIINLSRISEVGRDSVLLDDGTNIPVGEVYGRELKTFSSSPKGLFEDGRQNNRHPSSN